MTSAAIANAFVIATFLVACFRARLVALALAPPALLILAQAFDLVDLSSASHPLRWIVPVACAGLSGFAAWGYTSKYELQWWQQWEVRYPRVGPRTIIINPRALIASILVLASNGPDLLALHPFFWARFQTWPLNPLTIALCATVCAVLVAPERWVSKWLR